MLNLHGVICTCSCDYIKKIIFQSLSSEESSLDTARVSKYLNKKKSEPKQWWAREDDEDDDSVEIGWLMSHAVSVLGNSPCPNAIVSDYQFLKTHHLLF